MRSPRRVLVALVLLLPFLSDPVTAASTGSDREGFALVLGGGGARGFAHIGVLHALDELGLTPSLVVGTSMGAIVGSLYASGLDVDAIEDAAEARSWLRVLLDRGTAPEPIQSGWSGLAPAQVRLQLDAWPPRLPPGASHGHAAEALVGTRVAAAAFAADNDFDALPVPFRAVATDLVAGERVVFDHGPLPRVVRASGSLPVIFVPVELDGRLLVDGGILENLPLSVARELGFERALVVDVSSAFLPIEEVPDDFFSLVERSTQLVQMAENRIDPAPGDVVLRLDLRDHTFLSFYSMPEIVARGYEAAMAHRDEILALAEASGPAARRPRPPVPDVGPQPLMEVEVRGARRMSDWSIRKRLGVAPGDTISLDALYVRAEELARQSLFESIWVEPRPVPGGAHVTVHVDESDRPELEIAANYRDEIGPGALLRLRLDNRFGAGGSRALSWRIDPETAVLRLDTAVPIGGARDFEFRLGGGWINERIDVQRAGGDAWHFRRGVVVAEAVRAWGLGVPALSFGVEAAEGRRSLSSADPAGSGRLLWRAVRVGLETWNGGGLNTWPEEGISLEARHGVDVLGGRHPAWSIEGGWIDRLLRTERWGIVSSGGAAWSSPDLPVDLQARAGGPQGWVGQDPDAIIAPRLAWTRLALELNVRREIRVELAGAVGWAGQRRLNEQPPRPGVQVRLIWESALGPIQLGWAGGRGSEPRLVLDVGNAF